MENLKIVSILLFALSAAAQDYFAPLNLDPVLAS